MAIRVMGYIVNGMRYDYVRLYVIVKKADLRISAESGTWYRVLVLTSQVTTFVPGQRSKVTES